MNAEYDFTTMTCEELLVLLAYRRAEEGLRNAVAVLLDIRKPANTAGEGT